MIRRINHPEYGRVFIVSFDEKKVTDSWQDFYKHLTEDWDEQSYIRGERAAYESILYHAMAGLGFKGVEKEELVSQMENLRNIIREDYENENIEFDESLHLADSLRTLLQFKDSTSNMVEG